MIDQRWRAVRICNERSADKQDTQPGGEYEKRGRMTPVPQKQGKAQDQERAFALNMLDCRRPDQRGLIVSNVIGIFRKLWAESWGPRMEDLLRNGLYALIEQPRSVSILALPKLLTDRAYREQVLGNGANGKVHRSRLEMLLSAKEHEMHHRAQLMLIERQLGIVPHLTRQMQARMEQMMAAQAKG